MTTLQTEMTGGVLIMRFDVRRILDDQRIRQLGEEMRETARVRGEKKVVVNFAGVEYMSSAMIGEIVHLNKFCKDRKAKLLLCCLSDKILEGFEMLNLHRTVKIYETEGQALAALNWSPWKPSSVLAALNPRRSKS